MNLLRLLGYVLVGIGVVSLLWLALWVVVATVEPVTAWIAEGTVITTSRVYARDATPADVRALAWVLAAVSLLAAAVFGGFGALLVKRSRG